MQRPIESQRCSQNQALKTETETRPKIKTNLRKIDQKSSIQSLDLKKKSVFIYSEPVLVWFSANDINKSRIGNFTRIGNLD